MGLSGAQRLRINSYSVVDVVGGVDFAQLGHFSLSIFPIGMVLCPPGITIGQANLLPDGKSGIFTSFPPVFSYTTQTSNFITGSV